MLLYNIIERIEKNLKETQKRPFVVAIDGMSASGKTTLGNSLHEHFPESILFHMDDYFLQPHQRTCERLSEVGGNVDYERFKEEIILHLNDENGITHRKYDCQSQTLDPKLHADWKPVIIIEGAYSQHPYFGDVYDLCVFCEISPEEQRKRILKRNGAKMLKRFESEWIPKENAYFAKYKIKEQSGLL
jgi:uridine kinase